jgi:uncharacterized SAM-binding protein YcdF (DUF218 family)
VFLALASFAGATAYLFLWPGEDAPPSDADAVVVLSGGRGHRLAEGRRLVRDGVAETLVISDGLAAGWDEANRLCRTKQAVCFEPKPYSTQGEARWIAREAARRGWDSVVVVTSTYHVRRTRMVVGRCYDGELAVDGAEPPFGNKVIGVAWEWPKTLYYLTLKRGC